MRAAAVPQASDERRAGFGWVVREDHDGPDLTQAV